MLLAWSFKESAFKAIDRFLGRFVSWQEVDVTPCSDGSCQLKLIALAPSKTTKNLQPPGSAIEGPVEPEIILRGQWFRSGDFLVTVVEARRIPYKIP